MNWCSLVALHCLIVRRPNLQVVTRRYLHDQVQFSTMSCIKVCPYTFFLWWGYFQSPWMSFITTDEFSVWVIKFPSKVSVSWIQSIFLFLTYFELTEMAILSKGHKADNFESCNCLKRSFTNIWGLCSNFVERESFLESNSLDILALCERNLDGSIDSGNSSVRGYFPLIQKDSLTHIHALAHYVKEGLSFACIFSRKVCRFLLRFLTGYTSFSALLLFPLSITFFVFMHCFWCYFI